MSYKEVTVPLSVGETENTTWDGEGLELMVFNQVSKQKSVLVSLPKSGLFKVLNKESSSSSLSLEDFAGRESGGSSERISPIVKKMLPCDSFT